MDHQILLVSQFTLYHKMKGTKPDFHGALANEKAKELYELFLKRLKEEFIKARVKAKAQSNK